MTAIRKTSWLRAQRLEQETLILALAALMALGLALSSPPFWMATTWPRCKPRSRRT